jgi:hypothetical protein
VTRKPVNESLIAAHNRSRIITVCAKAEKCSYLIYQRSDRTVLDEDRKEPFFTYFFFDGPWSKEMEGFPGIIVINRGAHWVETDEVLPVLRKAFTFLRASAPNAMIFFRTTPPGHLGCADLKEPLEYPQPIDDLPNHWGHFWGQNRAVVEMINNEFPGIGVLDVSLASGTRADGHRSERLDCLHYDDLEPYTFWNDLLVNTINALEEAGGLIGGPPEATPRAPGTCG